MLHVLLHTSYANQSCIQKGVLHEVTTLRFKNFRPPFPCTCTYASLHSLPLVRVFGYDFLKKCDGYIL